MVVEIKQPKINKYKATYPHYKRLPKCPVGWTFPSRMRDPSIRYIMSSVLVPVVKMASKEAALIACIREDPTEKEAKNKETMQAYEKIEKLQGDVNEIIQAYEKLQRDVDVRRLQRQQNVYHNERYNALKTLLDQAKDRKDIPEYKHYWKEITGHEIDIYTKAYSKDKLFPPDHDKNKSAEFWFDYN